MTLKGHSNNIMFLSVSISHIVTINLGLGGHMTYALGSSGTMSMAMSSFVCLFVCLFVCVSVLHFSQPWFNPVTVTLVSYPGMANQRSLLNLDLIRPC